MKVSVLNMSGKTVGAVDLPASIFEANINRDLMHQALVRQLANRRRGTHNAKTRAEVRRTGAKWYRQKGTGRARHGSRRAPIFVGGGVAHGPRPRSYEQDMPRKMRRAALRSALSAKAQSGDIVVLDALEMSEPKTKEIVGILDVLAGQTSTLVLIGEANSSVEKSARNLADVKTLGAGYLNIRDLLGHQKIVMPLAALEVIQGYLGPEGSVPAVAEFDELPDSTDEEE
ncbi:MAG TPA: 50S ribosomal protein L4 [Anaerolineae bacterium]|jgi:large subunit ribosomal protein L4|nr:50S ribosomal protein L4 [Anaerolineae bacterium]